MGLDDIRDRFLEGLQAAKGRLEESDSYIQLKERFDGFNPLAQKAILGAVGFLLLYALFQIPMSYYSSGSENVALFEENRDLILDLYRVKRRAILAPQAPPPMSNSDLEIRARNAISSARIPADQVKSVAFFDNAGARASSFIPKNVEQKGVEVQILNLNVSQIVEVGHALSTIGESAKMVGLQVKPGSHPGSYFDATFKIVSFAVATSGAGKRK